MASFYDRVKVAVAAAAGTGSVALGAAVAGYRSFDAAAVPDQGAVSYVIEDGAAWEIGHGVYTKAGATLARTTVIASSAGGAAIAADASATVYLTLLAEDLAGLGASSTSASSTSASARYWRLYNYSSSSGNGVSIAELNLLDANNAVIPSTSAQGGPGLNSSTPAMTQDGNPSTIYDNASFAGNYLTLDMGAPVTPVSMQIVNRNDGYPYYNVVNGTLQCSSDGVKWHDVLKFFSTQSAVVGGSVTIALASP